MGPGDLQTLLTPLLDRGDRDPRLLVGMETSDDAGVFRLDGTTALVQTLDVITPVVDDPSDYGAIAAVNALSDIYAMGGEPLTALSFAAFDPCKLDPSVMAQALAEAADTLVRNGCCLVGGHTVDDPEIKLGFAVTGTIDPGMIVTNSGARAGDLIYLTKPIGTGIAATALKADMLDSGLLMEITRSMKTVNREASLAMREAGVSAATDVTGFGLLGHLYGMCVAAGMGAILDLKALPLFAGVLDLAKTGLVPAGAYANLRHLSDHVARGSVDEPLLLCLCDPQTSGGLLMAIPPDRADLLEARLATRGVSSSRIGCFTPPPSIISLTVGR